MRNLIMHLLHYQISHKYFNKFINNILEASHIHNGTNMLKRESIIGKLGYLTLIIE